MGLGKDRGTVQQPYHPESKDLALKLAGVLKNYIASDYTSKNYETQGGFKNGILVFPYDSQQKMDSIKIITKSPYGHDNQDINNIDLISQSVISLGLKIHGISIRPDYPGICLEFVNKDYKKQ